MDLILHRHGYDAARPTVRVLWVLLCFRGNLSHHHEMVGGSGTQGSL